MDHILQKNGVVMSSELFFSKIISNSLEKSTVPLDIVGYNISFDTANHNKKSFSKSKIVTSEHVFINFYLHMQDEFYGSQDFIEELNDFLNDFRLSLLSQFNEPWPYVRCTPIYDDTIQYNSIKR